MPHTCPRSRSPPFFFSFLAANQRILPFVILPSLLGPHAAYTNSGAFLPLSVLTEEFAEIVAMVAAQEPTEYLPEGLDETLIAGYKQQLEVLTRQLNGTKSAVLELIFTGVSSFQPINLRVLSRGFVRLSPDDDGAGRGDAEPVVDYRALTNPVDVLFNRVIFKFIRRFFASEAMVEALDPTEVSPQADADSDEFEEWLRTTMNPSVAHPSGTCALGPIELGGVVGPDLRVHGTRKLRVADCSIMTLVPGTHTSSTAYAIGEKVCHFQLSYNIVVFLLTGNHTIGRRFDSR